MKIALIGYGKMGKVIEEIAVAKGHEIVLKIDIDNAAQFTRDNLAVADVAIEFTGPHSAYDNVIKCLEFGVPVVCGSTGWLENWSSARETCTKLKGTLVYSSNYSIGVNLFFELNNYLAKLMSQHPDYNVSMKEIHHTQKKDAPSGTAITLAKQLLHHIKNKQKWVNQVASNPEELEIISERTDPAPGTHSIKYHSPIDDIEIIHTAHNRKGFGGGAVLAAEFAFHNQGVFSMKDVLGL